MASPLSRRSFLRGAVGVGVAAAGLAGYEVVGQVLDLREQHETWMEASRSNQDFLQRRAGDVSRLTIGSSFAPEQWHLMRENRDDSLAALAFAVRDLGMRQMRLGLRWSRSVNSAGEVDLSAYRPYLDYCVANGVDICLNAGPIRTFRWPEEHVPASVLESLQRAPAAGSTIRPDSPLAHVALEYMDSLFRDLRREYGADVDRAVRVVQVENEGFYPLGTHKWRLSHEYVATAVRHAGEALPSADLLLSSASRLNLDDIQGVFRGLLSEGERYRGRLVSGFDYHYKTPRRDSKPIARYFDQISYSQPFTQPASENIRRSRSIGYRIEVTEAQMEPYGHLTSPGNSARDLRYALLRCLDKVLDPEQPALIRVWGVEELAKRFLRGEATGEHRQMAALIQAINGVTPSPDAPSVHGR